MIVTPFGDLEFQNHPMTAQWIAAHGTRHRTYELAMSRAGRSIQPAPIFGDLSLEWVRLHYLQHVTLLRMMMPDSSVSAQVLSMSPLDNELAFQTWHRMHTLLHSRLDQALQVT